MSEARKLRVAVAGGAGNWGAKFMHAYARRTDCEVVALVDTARERRKEFAAHYGIRSEYDTVHELLARDVPDIVTAILPVSAAHEAVVACANAGVKVVSCEKPLSDALWKADEMVSVCAAKGVPFGCGTAMWEVRNLPEVCGWIREGNIGELTGASIRSGLVGQVSGTGCVPLNFLRFLTGMEVVWVEGWTEPEEAADSPDDCTAYGLLGLSGGITCTVANSKQPNKTSGTAISIIGTEGMVWVQLGRATLVRGTGTDAFPVIPDFMRAPDPVRSDWTFQGRIDSFVRAFETREDPPASGYDYRQVLEIAMALKVSAREEHRRVGLPLEDRSVVLTPRPWRLLGGDVAGWDEVGHSPKIIE